jgi:hypothetical protein
MLAEENETKNARQIKQQKKNTRQTTIQKRDISNVQKKPQINHDF